MKFGLTNDTIAKICSVLEKHPEVAEAVIYGSRAKGTYRNGSDIDLTLKGADLTYNILSAITLEIDDLNTPYFFDLSIFHKLKSPDLEEHIQRVGQQFYLR